ncbi:hypothetical protein MASR1M32_32960 [Rhodobacter sp.]
MFTIEVMPCAAQCASPAAVFSLSLARCPAEGRGSGSPGGDAKLQMGIARQLQHRTERLELAQFARGGAVGVHHHHMSRRHGGAMKQPCGLQRRRVGPDRMVIGRHHCSRAVGKNAVQILPGHRGIKNLIRCALRHHQRQIGVGGGIGLKGCTQRLEPLHPAQLQLRQLVAAQHKMQMAFDKARQQRPPARVDHFGVRAGQGLDLGPRAHGKNAVPADGHRLGPRRVRVHRQHLGIGDDHICLHRGLPFHQS